MIAIVFARKGSKGIPRKNMKEVGGLPLFLKALKTLKQISDVEIWLSTDCDEMASLARMNGFNVHRRKLVSDSATISDSLKEFIDDTNSEGPYIIVQPTSPFITAKTIASVCAPYLTGEFDSVGSAVPWGKVVWKQHLGRATETLLPRVNRQQMYEEGYAQETGGVLITSFRNGELIQNKHGLVFVSEDEGLDIDSFADLHYAQKLSRRKLVTIYIAASKEIGSGHLKRQLIIADRISEHHDVEFVYSVGEDWVRNEIQDKGFRINETENYYSDIVILDCLDTDSHFIRKFQAEDSTVFTFENLGSGSEVADLCINDMYNIGEYHGPQYTVLRNEFLYAPKFEVRSKPKRYKILVSFGGTDPLGISDKLTRWILSEISQAEVTVIAGIGNDKIPDVSNHSRVNIVRNVSNMAELMLDHDILVTGAGRTVHEAACIGIPTISIPVNIREGQHVWIPGTIRFGDYFPLISRDQITEKIKQLFNVSVREYMSNLSKQSVDHFGLDRVMRLMEDRW